MEFFSTLKEYKDAVLLVIGILSSAGIITGIIYAIKKYNKKLRTEGASSVQKEATDGRVENFVSDKQLREETQQRTRPEIDFFNAFDRWPTVAEFGEYKRTGVWAVPKA